MIKLTAIEPKGSYELQLRFSDGASDVFDLFDFSEFVEAGTEMTEPVYHGYKLELIRLKPYPSLEERPDTGDYCATLRGVAAATPSGDMP